MSTVLLCGLAGIDHGSPRPPASRRLEEGPHSAIPPRTMQDAVNLCLGTEWTRESSQVEKAVDLTMYQSNNLAFGWTISWVRRLLSCLDLASCHFIKFEKRLGRSIMAATLLLLASSSSESSSSSSFSCLPTPLLLMMMTVTSRATAAAAHRKTHGDSGQEERPNPMRRPAYWWRGRRGMYESSTAEQATQRGQPCKLSSNCPS